MNECSFEDSVVARSDAEFKKILSEFHEIVKNVDKDTSENKFA